jgi:hypothetical protein
MDKDKFMQEARSKRAKNIDELVLKVLTKMLNDDIRYLDTHYLRDRSLEIIEKTIAKLRFSNEQIQRARRAFLDVLLDGVKQQIFGFEDDYKEAKKNLKSKGERKRQAKETLDIIDRMRMGKPKDSTEQRNMECEPTCQLIASEILSKEVMLKDEDFVNGCIELDNEMLINTIANFYFGELIEQMVLSLDNSYIKANEVNWGCSRDKIKMSQIDNRIKK